MSDQQIHAYCLEWVKWCKSRGYYLKPDAKNILARMQPSRVGQAPNARNYPDMQYFNMAIHTIADMAEHQDGLACFKLFYADEKTAAKVVAANLDVSRPTYYNRTKHFARRAYTMSLSLKKATEEMKIEDFQVVD